MKKVCHITSSHQPRDQRIFLKQCVSLANKGYDVTLINRFESFEEQGVKVVGLGYGARAFGSEKSKFKLAKKALNIVNDCYKKAIEIDADIYQIHDPELLLIVKKLKKKGKIVIFDAHEDYIDRSKFPKLYKAYLKFHSRYLEKIITVTPHLVPKYDEFCKGTIILTNYPCIEIISALDDFENKNVICFAGGVSPQWSHVEITKAIQTLDLRYEICGAASDEYLKNIKACDETNKVNYRGIISASQVVELLQVSRIGMALVKYNKNINWNYGTLGNTKLFEYMRAGLPVICTDLILWNEIIEKYDCGICVPPDNEERLIDAIKYLLENPEIAKQMGENGRRAIKEEFNWGKEVEKLYELYESL